MIEGSTLYSQSSWICDANYNFPSYRNYSSMTHSSNSSDCGDDLTVELGISECSISNWDDVNILDSPLNPVLEGNLSDWVVSETTNADFINQPTSDSTEQNSRRKNNIKKNEKPKYNLEAYDKKKWSELSSTEQVKVVEELTQIISTQMGLREQLDVIRIIDPTAVILTTDTEFVIDLNCIDDNKWRAITKTVQKTTNSTTTKRKRQVKSKNNSQQKQITCKQQQQQQNQSTATKRKNRQQKMQMKAVRDHERKQLRQLMKEHKSGLFKREEILSLSSTYLPDEEIDILD